MTPFAQCKINSVLSNCDLRTSTSLRKPGQQGSHAVASGPRELTTSPLHGAHALQPAGSSSAPRLSSPVLAAVAGMQKIGWFHTAHLLLTILETFWKVCHERASLVELCGEPSSWLSHMVRGGREKQVPSRSF